MRFALIPCGAILLVLAGAGPAWPSLSLFRCDGRLYPALNGTNSVTRWADVNQDGTPDLLSLQNTPSLVPNGVWFLDVWLGTPTGLSPLALESLVAGSGGVPNQTYDMALVDLDADGWVDVVATTDFGIELMKNQHDGHFVKVGHVGEPSTTLSSVAAADLDLDGDIDLLLTDRSRKDLRLYLGNGGVTFTAGPVFPIPSEPRTLGVASLDVDTFPDIVAGCQDSSVVFHGGPSLSFTRSTIMEGYAMIAGNLDGDGRPDLITDAAVRLSSSSFAAALPQPVDSPVATYDLDGDGRLDLLGMPAPITGQSPRLIVSYGYGGGRFAPPTSFRRFEGRRQVPSIADFDQDGVPDVAYAPGITPTSFYGSNAYVLRGLSGGAFENGRLIPTPAPVSQMATGRLNADGVPDFVIWDAGTSSLRTMLSDGHGGYTFSAPVPSSPGTVANLRCTDFNGDGIDDVFCRYQTTSEKILSLWFTGANGALGPRIDRTISPAVIFTGEAVAGDFNGDHRGDVFLVAITTGVNIACYSMRGLGNGNFTVSSPLRAIRTIRMIDMNHDGSLDAVGVEFPSSTPVGLPPIAEYLPTTPGDFSMSSLLEQGNISELVGVGDLDGDGAPDVLARDDSSHTLFFRNLGNGTLAAPISRTTTLLGNYDLTLRDLDQDGFLDAYRTGSGLLFLWRGLGGMDFDNVEKPVAGGAVVGGGFAMVDGDGDGRLDAWQAVAEGILFMKGLTGAELLDAPPAPKPAAALALELRPNPSHGAIVVSLTAARAGTARIDVIGVDGRFWESRVVIAPAGRSTHTISGHMPSSIYFVRVQQGSETRVGRAIVLR